MKNEKKTLFTDPLSVALLILIGVLVVVLFLLVAARVRQVPQVSVFADVIDVRQNMIDARQNRQVINLAETWLTEELGIDLRTQPVSFDTRHNDSPSEIWRVEITNPTIATPTGRIARLALGRIATLNINRITGEITVMHTNFTEQEIDVNGANITVTNLTAIRETFPEREVYINDTNITINELQAQISQRRSDHVSMGGSLPATDDCDVLDITEIAAIVATEITQKFDTNLDGANFIMVSTVGFWSINVLLNPEQMRIGELPHIAPDFHALFDVDFNLNRILSLTDF